MKYLISVLMPVFNEEKFVLQAVSSILEKEYKPYNIEICIVDDFSTDLTYELLLEKKKGDERIKLFRNDKKGKNNAFNLAFKESKGDFFVLFAGDDILVSNLLLKRIKPLVGRINPAITLCKLKTTSTIKKFDGVTTPRRANEGSMSGGCMAMNRAFIESAFPLPLELGNEDQWLVEHIRHFFPNSVIHIPKVGIIYRIHEKNSSSRTDPFFKKNKSMHHRFMVYSVFLEKYRGELSSRSIHRLSAQAAAETLRYQGNWLSILMMSGLTLFDKARMIMHSNAFFYWVRTQLFSLLSGRG